MGKVKFIDIEYFNNHTPVDGNVDFKLIKPLIYKAQDIHIQQVTGSKLYNRLKELIITGQIVEEEFAKYKLLLDDYIRPTLAEWTLYELLPFMNFKLTNKSISKRTSENSGPSEVDEIKWLRSSVRDSAEFYTKRIVDYLIEYKLDYPELITPTKCDEIRPSGRAFFGGVYFPRDYNRDRCNYDNDDYTKDTE
jgi:hypothetical protein